MNESWTIALLTVLSVSILMIVTITVVLAIELHELREEVKELQLDNIRTQYCIYKRRKKK